MRVTMRVCAFFERVFVMDREEHCLKLVTGGKTSHHPVLLFKGWGRLRVKGWPEDSRNPPHVYQELPADIFKFHARYKPFHRFTLIHLTVLVSDIT